jgi:hypothetical protein
MKEVFVHVGVKVSRVDAQTPSSKVLEEAGEDGVVLRRGEVRHGW